MYFFFQKQFTIVCVCLFLRVSVHFQCCYVLNICHIEYLCLCYNADCSVALKFDLH